MFINLNNLKGILIDIDSFPRDMDESWVKIDKFIKLLFFSNSDERIEFLEKKYPEGYFYKGTPIGVTIKKKVLIDMFKLLSLDSEEVVFFSGDYNNIIMVQDISLATIEYNNKISIDFKDVGKLPDFQISSLDDLILIINGDLGGYFSEVCSIIDSGNSSKLGSVITTTKKVNDKEFNVVSGGRYFNNKDVRAAYHQLSRRILRNKNNNSKEEVFKNIFNDLIRFVDENVDKVDGITRIPNRPSQNGDRFYDIVKSICSINNFENYCENLECIRDYPSQKGLNEQERANNIEGVFSVKGDFNGKHIVLIDDVLSTGSTAFEAVKEIYSHGARRVTILVLAINQLANNIRWHTFKPLKCTCGKESCMRFNRQTGAAFFGCSSYPDCKNTQSYNDAIELHNVENRIIIDQENDEEWVEF